MAINLVHAIPRRARFRDGVVTTHTVFQPTIVTAALIISDILKERTEPSKRASDSVARTGVVVGPNPIIVLRGVVGIHVYHAILVYTEIHQNIGMLHSLVLMDPVECRVVNMDSTKG